MSVDTNAVKSSLDEFCAAWKKNDGEALAAFFVDDGTLINPFGQRADGRGAVAAMYGEYFGSLLRGTSTAFDLTSVRSIGQDHALVDGEQAIFAADGTVVLALHLAALLRSEAGAWRFIDARPYAFVQP